MKARKIIVSIETESLSLDCVPSMLYKIIQQLEDENTTGELVQDDGDTMKWKVGYLTVEF